MPAPTTATQSLMVLPLDTVNLGDRSYVIAVDGQAAVIDPQRDIDRILDLVAAHDLTIALVVETHIHNDYVTGGFELAKKLDATYVVPAGYDLQYQALQLSDGQTFTTGSMLWRAMHTPGHTPQHLSYVVSVDAVDQAAFTGGSLLFGSVGRPDLIGPQMTGELAHAQWRSVRRLTTEVAADAEVFPTHGFGSFCSATATTGLASTIGQQARSNPAALLDEATFVEELIDGLDAYPAYYQHMAPTNQAGPAPIDLSLPELADADDLRRRIDAGEWVVDLRSRRVFASRHLRGTLSFDGEGNAVTYLAWLIPWGTPLTILADTPEAVTAFQRELVRIGIDRPAAHNTGQPDSWARNEDDLANYDRVDFTEVAHQFSHGAQLVVLDARRDGEWHDGHVDGAKHVPLHELPQRLDEVATWVKAAAHAGHDPRVWTYCGSGFRAAVASSLLERHGLGVVHIDDDFGNADKAGLPVVSVHDGLVRIGDNYSD